MTELKRLPRGYRTKIDSLKKQLNSLLKEISNLGKSKGYPESFDTKLSSIAMHIAIKQRIQTASGVSLKFDHWGLSGTIFADNKTEKFTLGSRFDLVIPELDSVVYNCKW